MSAAVKIEPVQPFDKYDTRNEHEFRQQVFRELAQKHDRRTNFVVPYGQTFTFAGENGESVTLVFDGGTFSVVVDAGAPTNFATEDYVNASITTEATVRANADTALASSITTVSAQVGSNTASISTIQTALAGGGGALALLAFQVNTGTNAAVLKLISTSGGTWSGSAISLTASSIVLDGDVIVTGTFNPNRIQPGKLGFEAWGIPDTGTIGTSYTTYMDETFSPAGVVQGQEVVADFLLTLSGGAPTGSGYEQIIVYAEITNFNDTDVMITDEQICAWVFVDGDLFSPATQPARAVARSTNADAINPYRFKVKLKCSEASSVIVTDGKYAVRLPSSSALSITEPV